MIEAGPELDSMVARIVFGYVVIIDTKTGENYTLKKDRSRMTLPPYSTDLSSAYLIAELLNGKGYSLQVKNVVNDGSSKWIVCFTMPDNRKYLPVVTTTLPQAICLAGLDAVRGLNVHAG